MMSTALENIRFQLTPFNDLSPAQLYAIIRLREAVFVVEQNCPYLDCDNKDQYSWHYCFYLDEKLVGYARLLPTGSPSIWYIGRVVVHPDFRRIELGKHVMNHSIGTLFDQMKCEIIEISAQVYLKRFYEDLGFRAIGEDYLEDDIPHIKMICNKPS